MMTCERNWADLHRELLGLILDKLVLTPDYIRFGAVCKSWESVTADQHQDRIRRCCQEPPMLLIPAGADDKDHRFLYSMFEHKVYRHPLHVPHRRRCCGSSFGWLALADLDVSLNLSVTLLNPFFGSTIRLPPILKISEVDNEFHDAEYFLYKVFLSCDPCLHPNDWVAVAVYGETKKVAFIRSGDRGWTYPCENFFPVEDACFYQGKLYSISCRADLIAIDLSQMRDEDHHRAAVTMKYLIKYPVHERQGFLVAYLVELAGELLLVRRVFFREGDFVDVETTVGFKVSKLSPKQSDSSYADNSAHWVEIHDLGNVSLFLGGNQPTCVSTSNFPNCQPNCIYFTDDCVELDPDLPYEADDMGIFDLTTRQINKYYTLEQSQRYMPPTVWISPRLGLTCFS